METRSPWLVALVSVAVVAAAAIVSVSVGAVAISPLDTIEVLIDRLTPLSLETSSIADPIIWNIRLPRVMAAVGAGAALGLAGVVLQGLYRNPVADPQLVGMSPIASIGVLIGLLVAWSLWGPVAGVVGGAIAGALGAGIVRILARTAAGDPSRFILVGIGFGLSVTAVVAAASIALNDPRVPDVPFWFVGGLGGATWGTALWASLFALVALGVVMPFHRALDTLSLGHAAAEHVGVDVKRMIAVTLAAAGLAVGGATGAAGVVAFVGLIGATVARRWAGDHHDRLVVAGAATGAVFLVTADAIGRLIGGRFEVPVGLVTAAIGGPFLVWLIVSRRVTP